jgi:hypothetical protein
LEEIQEPGATERMGMTPQPGEETCGPEEMSALTLQVTGVERQEEREEERGARKVEGKEMAVRPERVRTYHLMKQSHRMLGWIPAISLYAG